MTKIFRILGHRRSSSYGSNAGSGEHARFGPEHMQNRVSFDPEPTREAVHSLSRSFSDLVFGGGVEHPQPLPIQPHPPPPHYPTYGAYEDYLSKFSKNNIFKMSQIFWELGN